MALSPTDPLAPESALRRIAVHYESALNSVQSLDLESVQDHLDQIDSLTKGLRGLGSVPMDRALLDQVQDSHGRLLTALAAERSKSKSAIEQTSVGRKALRGYGNRSQVTGTQIESLS